MSKGKHEQSGALENLLKRLGGGDQHLEHDRMARSDLRRVDGGKGYFKKALRWLVEAQNMGYDALIFLIDVDGIPRRIREIREAQDHVPLSHFPRAVGVATRTFDAGCLRTRGR